MEVVDYIKDKPLLKMLPRRYPMRQYSTRWIEMATSMAHNKHVVKHHFAYVQHDLEVLYAFAAKLIARHDGDGTIVVHPHEHNLLELDNRFFSLDDGREYFAREGWMRNVNRCGSFDYTDCLEEPRPYPDAACHCVEVHLPRAFKRCGSFKKVRQQES